MSSKDISTRMCWWLYFIIMSMNLSRAQNSFGGGGFLADPFLELTGGVPTSAVPKSSKVDPPCLSNGALAGAIIGTMIMSAFIGFLTWLIYLRPKFKELNCIYSNESRKLSDNQYHHRHQDDLSNSKYMTHSLQQHSDDDQPIAQLPLDVTDYKFGTFPFRQSQASSVNGNYTRTDWLTRISSSFRSTKTDKEFEIVDVPLLDPAFSGLNFSITGNMRAGIFIKELIRKETSEEVAKRNVSTKLKAGDRIMSITVCFESIVYEDALTILSYASPYPVILRVKRQPNLTKVNEISEKQPTPMNTTNKVKWQDEFDHYDNDTSLNGTLDQQKLTTPFSCLPPIPRDLKADMSPKKSRPRASTQSRAHNKPSPGNKGNKIRTSSSSVIATSGATTKRCNNDIKRQRAKATNNHNNSNNNNNTQRSISKQLTPSSPCLTTKPPTNTKTSSTIPTNPKTMRSITESVMSYLHYNKADSEEGLIHSKDASKKSDTPATPYYDSPYDYYYGGQVSQYQYLHQSHLNKNNNNSLSTESLTAVTPNFKTSVYTVELMSTKSDVPPPRRRERRLSSPAIITITAIDNPVVYANNNENLVKQHPDTSV